MPSGQTLMLVLLPSSRRQLLFLLQQSPRHIRIHLKIRAPSDADGLHNGLVLDDAVDDPDGCSVNRV